MGDTFTEQIIKKKLGAKDYIISILLAIVSVAVIMICWLYLMQYIGSIIFIIMAGIIYGYYKLITMRNLEYEYSFTNGDLTVDKIINRQRRKRVISFDVKTVEEMGKYDAAKLEHRSFDNRYFTGSDESGKDCWYIACRSQKTGHALLVFEPNDKVLDAIKTYLPRQVKTDAFGR